MVRRLDLVKEVKKDLMKGTTQISRINELKK